MLLLKLATVLSFLCLCKSEFCDYYWRDYNGEIPSDAIQAGTRKGKPFYIGQAYIRGKELLPATIFDPSTCEKPIASAYNQVLEVDTNNLKILCSPVKENFRWITTTSRKLHLIKDTHFVIGGSEVGQQLFIGRVQHDNKTVLGKIFQHSERNRGIWIPTKRGHEKNFESYEVLTFICGQDIDERFGR